MIFSSDNVILVYRPLKIQYHDSLYNVFYSKEFSLISKKSTLKFKVNCYFWVPLIENAN